ncbi:PREDICTED: Friend virus susceptibility protein 1-like, partial [Chinchilla lanigera]|uniref:Friend virus susceptibility protein 1-like n=1 Tax=Chinchilla lanigera TaxID=34839 RepID=UPI000697CE6E
PRRVSEAKVRALIGKEWDPINWDGDVWEDPEEVDDVEFLDADEIILPEEEVSPPALAEALPPPLPELLASPSMPRETRPVLMPQNDVDIPQDPPSPPIFASRPITRLKSQKAPKGDVHTVTHEEVRYSPKELLEFSNSYKQRPNEQVWEWILRVWDNGGKNIHLDQAEFIDMGPLSRDSEFNVAARGVKKGVNSLFGWLAEVWIKRRPTVNELEMPDVPWFTTEEGIQRLREMGMLEWICQAKPNPPYWDDPENISFTNTLRNRFVRG